MSKEHERGPHQCLTDGAEYSIWVNPGQVVCVVDLPAFTLKRDDPAVIKRLHDAIEGALAPYCTGTT